MTPLSGSASGCHWTPSTQPPAIDSTMRANISVGPPVELAIYRHDELALGRRLSLDYGTPMFRDLQKRWNEGLRRAFERLPRFDWERE